jgi:PAS domain S-box-containing protein
MYSPDDKTQRGIKPSPTPAPTPTPTPAPTPAPTPTPAIGFDHVLNQSTQQERSTFVELQQLQHYQLELVMQNDTLRQAQQALAESHDRYADLFESAPVGYLTLDDQGKISRINRAGAELLGGERAKLTGCNFSRFVAANDADRWHLHLVGALEQDEKQVCELMLAPQHNTIVHVRVGSRRSIQDGQVRTIQVVLTDIGELKRAQFEMHEAQHLARVGNWSWDAKTGDLAMSQVMAHIFGRDAIPPFPEQRGVMYSEQTWERLNSAVEHAVQDGTGYDLELPALRGDGGAIWINTRCKVVRDADGAVCGLRGTVQDITHRRQAEEQAQFQAGLLNAIGQAVIATDGAGIITYMNVAAERIYGWRPDTAVGRSILEVTVPDVSLSQANDIMGQLGAGLSWSGEFAVQHRDGRVFPAEVHNTPIMDRSGKVVGIIGVSSDISLRKQIEQSLALSEVRYQAVVDALSEGVVLHGRDGAVVTWNGAAERILGLCGIEVAGLATSVPTWRAVREDGTVFPGADHPAARAMLTGMPQLDVTMGIYRSDGALRWIVINAVPMRDPGDASTLGVVVSFSDTTALKQAQLAARESERMLDVSMQLSHTGAWDLNFRDNSVKRTPGYDLIFGYAAPPPAWNYAIFLKHVHEDDRAEVDRLFQRSVAAQADWNVECRIRRADGEIRWILVSSGVHCDEHGQVWRLSGIVKDITLLKAAEQIQRASAGYARSLIEASLDPLVTISAAGKITDVNDASVNATGVPREQLIGTDFSDYFTDPDQARAGYRKVFSEGLVRDFPLALRHRDGQIMDVLYNASVYKDGVGNVLGVFAAARDVTVQKQASRYARSLIEASLDPLVTISVEGKITDVNAASVQATGVPREALIGTDFCDYFTDPDEARAGYRKVFSEGFVRDFPLAVRHRDGQIMEVLYNATVYKGDDGDVIGVFAAARDVTERNRLDQVLHDRNGELQRATIVAEAANLAKSNFLSSMSHELRTPLNAVLGFAQLIEIGSPPPTPEQTKSLNQILKGGWYLLELINEILDLALIESGKATLSREAVSLGEVLLECEALVAPLAQQRRVVLDFQCGDTPHFVHSDRTRIKQVLLNLLSNAIKYNRQGGAVVVTIEPCPAPAATLRISVRDTGTGLSREQLAQLFQPFNRLGKEAGVEEGSGIGLVVTKRLVELMGGSIGVDSTIDVGSTFWIELALASAPHFAEHEVALAESRRAVVAPETEVRSVLYVEDNPANLALVEQLVARRGDLCLLSAADGHRGIALARAHQPDVILMDINLPGISGLEAMRLLSADPTTAHIPVIAISANAMPRDIEKCLEAGFFDYLTKPIMVHPFLDTLDKALDSAKMGATARRPPS